MNRESTWNDIIHLTQRMLSHAGSGEWNTVIEMESQRQDKMQAYFTTTPSQIDVKGIIEGISTVMELDKEIMGLGKSDLTKLSSSLEHIHRGKKAQFAYQKLA